MATLKHKNPYMFPWAILFSAHRIYMYIPCKSALYLETDKNSSLKKCILLYLPIWTRTSTITHTKPGVMKVTLLVVPL